MVEETLLTCYRYHTMSVKSRYTNKGGTTCQHAIKNNIINFAQNLENAIKVLDTLQSSLESC